MTRLNKQILILMATLAMGIFGLLGLVNISSASAALDVSVTLKLGDDVFVFREPDVVYAGNLSDEIASHGKFDAKGRFLGFSSPIERRYALTDIDGKLADINALVFVEAKPAVVKFNPANPAASQIVPDVPGVTLDVARLKKEITKSLLAGESYFAEITPMPYRAELTTEEAKASLSVCARFSTDISSSTENRKNNVRLALKKFNGRTFRRGETGSFNEIVGPRTERNGFRVAKIIQDGEFVEGVGGGVCQASTTLYNALLLANGKILERHHHSLRVSYVQPSFDAMVSTAADMKFECTKTIMHIVTRTDSNRAIVEIYAKKDPFSITRKSVVVSEGAPPEPERIVDTEGKYRDFVRFTDETYQLAPSKGELRSEGWLLYSDGRKERIRTDVYRSQKGKVVVGAEPRPAQ